MYIHIWAADMGPGECPREKTSSALFFKYNAQLGPPYQVLVDTNFINFAIKNKVALAPPIAHPCSAAHLRYTQLLCRIRVCNNSRSRDSIFGHQSPSYYDVHIRRCNMAQPCSQAVLIDCAVA